MVGVVVTGSDHLHALQFAWINHPFGHSLMWLVGLGVFPRQGIRKVGIEEELLALPFYEEAALADPPEEEVFV